MKTILIIGASSDIGREISLKFATKGYNIILASRNIQQLINIKKKINTKTNVECEYYYFDINENGNEEILLKLKKIPEILISTIGLNQTSDFNKKNFEKIVNTNFFNQALFIEKYISLVIKYNIKSSILVFTSIAGIRGRAINYIYGSAKSAMIQYLSGLRQKYSDKIHVMTIIPGYIKTTSLPRDKHKSRFAIKPEKMANIVFNSYRRKRNVIYTPKWFFLSFIIKMIPEIVFKKLRF